MSTSDSHDSGLPNDGNRRRDVRVPVELDVDYMLKDNYLFARCTDISATGIFIRTTLPEAPGTRLNLRFKTVNEAEPIEVAGDVVWVNSSGPSAPENVQPGMGIRFVELDFELRDRLRELVRRFAFLDSE
ncbi:MAG: TIGR02266 family protein [Deltaproteobacteria bacterium]|nr:TIGR02266 family protein [Deltaproteobacteria bacterium]MDQ3299704.1 TIGR02266 family protein [Myxococcota bacterium]